MIVDALVLAGGRSSRLGGSPKAGLVVEGRTLLERSLDALSAARSVVVVGDPAVVAGAAPGRALTVTREEPAFGGPAAGIAAGLRVLLDGTRVPPDRVLVLACDMPDVAGAVDALLASGAAPALARSADGRLQQLVALVPTAVLETEIHAHADELDGLSVRALWSGLDATAVDVPAGSTDDIDTSTDAETHGARPRQEERA